MIVLLMHTYSYVPRPMTTWQDWLCLWMAIAVGVACAAHNWRA